MPSRRGKRAACHSQAPRAPGARPVPLGRPRRPEQAPVIRSGSQTGAAPTARTPAQSSAAQAGQGSPKARPSRSGTTAGSGNRRPGFFERLDDNYDGVLTKGELPASTADLMMQADANKDGNITPEELRRASRQLAEEHSSARSRGPGGFFQRLEANKDGVLTRNELPPQLADGMMEADADKDGKLTSDELRKGAERFGKGQPRSWSERRRRWFQRLDADGDGAITPEKLPPRASDRIMAGDANGDGKVTLDEMEQVWRRGGTPDGQGTARTEPGPSR